MQYKVTYNAELHIVELKITGDITFREISEAAAAAGRMAKETGTDMLLNDCREARVRMNTFEIHEVPSVVAEQVSATGLEVHTFKRALVATQDLEDFKFFETVAVNRGQPMRMFTDIDEARRWLVGPRAEPAA